MTQRSCRWEFERQKISDGTSCCLVLPECWRSLCTFTPGTCLKPSCQKFTTGRVKTVHPAAPYTSLIPVVLAS